MKIFVMDKRLIQIRKRLGEYAVGKFYHKPLLISPALDETDAIMTGINIMGEELQSVTISRNYFNNIFNTVTDMVFLLNKKGKIVDYNQSACTQLGYTTEELRGMPVKQLLLPSFPGVRQMSIAFKNKDGSFPREGSIVDNNGQYIPVSLKAGIVNDGRQDALFLLTATDISYQQKAENLIIRAIIDTQEMERQRLAKDLHDSIAQQLSGIGYYISTTAHNTRVKQHKEVLLKANSILNETMEEIRNTCFNLMPGTLRAFGLIKAVNELCHHFLIHAGIQFQLQCPKPLPVLAKKLQIDVFRIMQELISNVIKHAAAKKIIISIRVVNAVLEIKFSDNGRGFNSTKACSGMGLQNVRSRVKSHNGTLLIKTNKGMGTKYCLRLPFINNSI